MADLDKVLDEPQAADFVDRPEDWLDDDEILVICGIEFPAQEFTELERAEWLKIREKYKLTETEQKYRDLLSELSKTDNSHLLKSKQERLSVVLDKITNFNRNTDPLKWTEELDEQVTKLAALADSLTKDIEELSAPQDEKLYGRIDEIQTKLKELKEARDPAFLELTWKLAKSRNQYNGSFADWTAAARGSDRLAAQELVYKGNFSWEAQRLSRDQRRAMLKTHKNKDKKRGGTTASTT